MGLIGRLMGFSDNLPKRMIANRICQSVLASFGAAEEFVTPYPHWIMRDVLPAGLTEEICALPFKAPELGGVSGKREKHNATRTYFDQDTQARFDFVEAATAAFQARNVVQAVEQKFGILLKGSYLRMEYAQDIDGFWLQPHSDLGVKLFTMLLYLSDDPEHETLGTDIYDQNKGYVKSTPFIPNTALVFVPSKNTYHGFEPRQILGVRKSLIINYVTDEWRDREQLAYPEAPITD